MNEPADLPLSHFMPGPMIEEGFTAHAGTPLPAGRKVASREAVIDAISTVYDPEIPVNIYDLGLIYEMMLDEKDGSLAILMTLTAPGCPVAGVLPGQVAEAAAGVEGVGEVSVTLTWDPPWDKERMSEDAKLALGIF